MVPTDIQAHETKSAPFVNHDSPLAQLAQILDSMQDAIMAISLPDHRLIYKSASFERVFGYPVQKFVDDPSFFKQVVHPDDLESAVAAQAAALRDGCVELDHRIVFPNGEVHWLHRRVQVIFDADRRPHQVIDTACDITAGKQSEAVLRESEEKYHSLLESSDSVIAMFAADGTVLYANEAAARPYGLSAQQLLGRPYHALFPPSVAETQLANLRTVIKTGKGLVREAMSIVAGKERWYRTSIQPVRSAAGTVTAALVNATDITASKQAEAALHEANRLLEQRIGERTAELEEERSLLRTVIDAIPDFIYVKDCQHRMLLNNLAHTELAGMTSAAELIGKTDLDLFPPALASQFHADEEALFASAQPIVNREERGTRTDGGSAWMLTTKVPLRNVHGEVTGLVGITRDITTLKVAEAAIKAALAHEQELGELKSRLVSMASHEFRNPLAAILATAETLALMWERMDKAKIDARLDRIRDQSLRLTAITEDVLQLTRLQTGRSKFSPAPGNLDELCARIVRDLAELPGNGDRIHYVCAQRPLPAVYDASLLQQAFGNLLHNALKYSPPEKSVNITLARVPGQITLRIADEGIGIPLDDLPRLFDPFHRAANVGAIQGTGLGLAIAKEAVELHEGTIAVESQVGAGTTFIVTFPAD